MDKINVTAQGTVLLVSKRDYTAKDGTAKKFAELSIRFAGSERVFVLNADDANAVSPALEGKTGLITLSLSQFKSGVFVRFVSVK